MPVILVAGCGQIGSAVGQILSQVDTDYSVILADLANDPPKNIQTNNKLSYLQLDVQNQADFTQAVRKFQVEGVLSSLPYFLNLKVAEQAKNLNIHYFDLTEDVETTAAIVKLAQGTDKAFAPQCGLAPGFINIAANNLMQHFDELDSVKLRCGALPKETSNSLKYALTWSIDGLINEYGNACVAVVNRQSVMTAALSDLEIVQLDGATYEAFNTSGGLGTLAEIYKGKIVNLNYKTLRYPGHCEKMQFLMNDLKLNEDRNTLKQILINALPHTLQDVVIVDVCVQGYQNKQLIQESYFKKFYPAHLNGRDFTAIQMSTASSVCVIIDLVLKNPQKYRGFVHQAQFSLQDFLKNRFARYFDQF